MTGPAGTGSSGTRPIGPAIVRPRVIELPGGSEPLLLDDALAPFFEQRERGVITIAGSPGGGKSMAARYLRAHIDALSNRPEVLAIEVQDGIGGIGGLARSPAPERGLTILLVDGEPEVAGRLASFRLAPWTRDDVLDYLLARFPERCRSVMERIDHELWNQRLEGRPLLWAAVLDALAVDEGCERVDQALRRSFEARDLPNERRLHALRYCMREALPRIRQQTRYVYEAAETPRLCRHRAAQVAIGVKPILADLGSSIMQQPWPRDLVEAAVPLLIEDEGLLGRLSGILRSEDRPLQRTAATLLHAATPMRLVRVLEELAAAERPLPRLGGAELQGLEAEGLTLAGIDLRRSGLARANFAGADLRKASLESCDLAGARFERARLDGADFSLADLHRSTLERASAIGASFVGVNLCRSQFLRTQLDRADLSDADLGLVVAVGASLRGACLHDAAVDGALFDGVHFNDADLSGVRLDSASVRACHFGGATLERARLEGMFLRQVRFEDANLKHALLTHSRFVGGDMRGADLRDAGLAEVDWSDIDLRGAHFGRASFHMGTTRSGKLDLGPSYGTRTGFYTDDYCDQNYRRPEEIRKASLRGCDLRGARVTGADFYLVDLRSARYTADQARHFQRCGAIMDAAPRG